MKKTLNVLIACGSGIATSSYAEQAIIDISKEVCCPIRTSKCTIQEAQGKAQSFDVVLFTSSNWNKYIKEEDMPCPAMSVASLITGINSEETIGKVKKLFTDLSG